MKKKKESNSLKKSKDEMNLAEFPVALVSKRASKGQRTVSFSDKVWNESIQRFVERKLTITSSDLYGLPTALDEEVLMGLVVLTERQGFKNRTVSFTRFELLNLLGWANDGRGYKRISDSISRWAGTLIISDNAYWNKSKKRWITDRFNMIDSVSFDGETTGGEERDIGSHFVWGQVMWDSFQSGNLKGIDFDFWRSLDSPVSKRLFRFLDKRFYFKDIVSVDLHRLAQDKVGLSRKLHTGQIKQQLKPANEELAKLGYCDAKIVRKGRGKWDAIYTKGGGTARSEQTCNNSLVDALTKRGVSNAQTIVSCYPQLRIERAIENFDDRKANGQSIGAGWLVACISDPDRFTFRKGYISQSAQAEKAAAKKQGLAESSTAKKENDKERQRCLQKEQEDKSAFLASIGNIPEGERIRLEDLGLERAIADGDTFLAKQIEECRRNAQPLSDASMLRRYFWKKYVLAVAA